MLWTWQIVNPTFWVARSDYALAGLHSAADMDDHTAYVMARPTELVHDLIDVLREWQGWLTFVVRYYPEYPPHRSDGPVRAGHTRIRHDIRCSLRKRSTQRVIANRRRFLPLALTPRRAINYPRDYQYPPRRWL